MNRTTLHTYAPFGSPMPGRTFNSNSYRYGGAGGQESDAEITGSFGNHYTAKYWMYDSRIGRRWNTDPISYFWQSPYGTFNNNPIVFIDPLGLFGTRKEARQYRKEHKDQFSGGSRIGKSGDGDYVIEGRSDGAQVVSINGQVGMTSGYTFTKPKTLGQKIGDYFDNPDNFSFGRNKPLNVFGLRVFNREGYSAIDEMNPPVSNVMFDATVDHTSNGIKTKTKIGVESTCETCTDVSVKQSTSIVLKPGTKLKNPSASDVSASLNLTFRLGHNHPAKIDLQKKLGGTYGPWGATYNTHTKDLTFSFKIGDKSKKLVKGKIETETKLYEETLYD